MTQKQMQVDLLQQAISRHQAGELQAAAIIYQQLLEMEPDHAEANHLLGLIAHQAGNHDTAAQLISKAIEKNPDQALYYSNLGIIKMALQRWDDAVAAFHVALESNHGDIKTHINLAVALEQTGKLEEALVAYQNALILAPTDTETLNKLGNAYSRLQRLEDATATYQRALHINPSSIATLNNLGIALRDHGKLKESIAAYQRALNISPDRVEIICNLALALLDAGRLREVEDACQQALSYNPAYAEIHKQLSDALHFQQRTVDWNAMLDTALEQADLSANARDHMLISKAIIAWIHGDWEAFRNHLAMAETILNCPPTDKVSYSAQGYYKFLQALSDFRGEHHALYAESADQNVHIIGDSHNLSYTGTVITLGGIKHRVVSHLIMGCKAWHLVRPGMNRFKASFDCALQQLPHGATAIISIGEIDCRHNEGVFPAHKKYQTDLKSSVESLANDFVQYVVNKAREKELALIFYGVPAPHCSLSHLSGHDRQTFLQTVELFNTCLAKAAVSGHCRFIDVYRQTITDGGVANDRYHIDEFHLSPDFLAYACRQMDLDMAILK